MKMVVVGAVAMNLRAADYVTFDLDICFERSLDNVERLCRSLGPICQTIRSAFFDTRDFLMATSKGEKFVTDLGDIEIGEVPGLGDYEACSRADSLVDLEGFAVQVLTLDGLIKAKEAANRPTDQAHLITLLALKEMEDEENKGSA